MTLEFKSIKNLPMHIAFIMDGNRRWAKKKKIPIIDGHRKGSEIIKKIVRKSLEFKIKYLTFYSFSTENWNRKSYEVNELQNLLKFYLESEEKNFVENKINFQFIGDINKFDTSIRNKLINLKNITSSYKNLYFILALNYGSRQEILSSIKKIDKEKIKNLSEKDIAENLMTSKIPNPDLVIRTSGEKRLSNFLLWQIAYSELYFTKTLWPDFNTQKYKMALKDYINRRRRFGGD